MSIFLMNRFYYISKPAALKFYKLALEVSLNTCSKIGQKLKATAHRAGVTLQDIGKELDETSKGTVVEKWIIYWKTTYKEYTQVGIDVIKDIRDHPFQSIYIALLSAAAWQVYKINPDERHYWSAVLNSANDIALLPKSLRKPQAENYVKFIQQCHQKGLIRRLNLLLASFMWTIDEENYRYFGKEIKYFKFPYTFPKIRVLDFGFMNNWWVLNYIMDDYDVAL
ncbi:mitochondrial import inner membrane translocase subunit Tim29-like [Agrilus planipennis]|uniref:Mitochondrial import inner membrane translocase subunit Tim29-like n=1 Tax=Agrilus planipennis TaxID=224129 RepID=A0A1W4X6D2_AGRPL|nr:mitochondrial import inner membrane translocase subunit Tim29-like [Agrilus planipennis]